MDWAFPFHGDLEAPEGLLPFTEQLASCAWPIGVVRSGFDGTLYLKARHADVELQMDSGQERSFQFSGVVDGTREHAVQRMTEFSDCLKQAGIVHCVELYEQPPPSRRGAHRQVQSSTALWHALTSIVAYSLRVRPLRAMTNSGHMSPSCWSASTGGCQSGWSFASVVVSLAVEFSSGNLFVLRVVSAHSSHCGQVVPAAFRERLSCMAILRVAIQCLARFVVVLR